MAWETWVQNQVASHQRLKKWYLIPPFLTLSNIKCISRVKWSNPGKGVAPSPTPRRCSYWKGSLRVALDNGHQLYFYSLNVKQFYLSLIMCYQSGLEWIWEQWQWRGTPHSQSSSLTEASNWLFCVISRTLVGEVFRDAVGVFCSPRRLE